MAYRLEFTDSAAKAVRGMPRQVAGRIAVKVESLADNPRPPGVKKLQGEADSYRVRVGDYRIIYTIDDASSTVVVVKVADRKDAYR